MSNEKATAAARQPKPSISFDPQYIGRITGVLLAICLVVALLLGVVNQITKPRIDAIEAEKVRLAMAQVLPAEEYVPVEASLPKTVVSLSQARSGGQSIGWVAETTATGSQGPITMMVGIDPSGKITGVSIVSHSETPNIGTKVVADQSVLDRFTGMSHEDGEITVNSGTNRFDGVSGATVSSRGVAAGVNAALDAVADLIVKEG
ncbi:MAG: RnfABCDGE type electron transport complex subunit G [Oscillospiraceae bacterium]|nr:RnfABCDGE type electron transport complex subunit G [Oscillospiraceae bacterium]